MLGHNLSEIVKAYTRVTLTSQSLLDLVFISSKVYDYDITLEDGISDHRLISINVMWGPVSEQDPMSMFMLKIIATQMMQLSLIIWSFRLILFRLRQRRNESKLCGNVLKK